MVETDGAIAAGGLVLYKRKPALVQRAVDKIDLQLEGGDQISVRPKDVLLLHPGPVEDLGQLHPPQGEVAEAWALLREEVPAQSDLKLPALAELVFGRYTPASAWAVWQLLDDGLYFRGSPEAIQVQSEEAVAEELSNREARAEEAAAWNAFLERFQGGGVDPELDRQFIREVEDLALGQREGSRVLQELGREEDAVAAHAFLLEVGAWGPTRNPYPVRLGLTLEPPDLAVGDLLADDRRDLTHLESFAIDDRENEDPDDALSVDGDLLWVHVADVAAAIAPDQPADLEARARAATIYLPEGAVTMLGGQMLAELGLGLRETSPALSFGLRVASTGEVELAELTPSWVRVSRTTYEAVDERLAQEPFRALDQFAGCYEARRQQAGALTIDLPETIISVVEGQVEIRPVVRRRSRDIVREAMLMVGEAVAGFMRDRSIPFPFVTQQTSGGQSPEVQGATTDAEDDLAAAFAALRSMSRSQVGVHPGPHAGLGLPVYTRVTSPLRRYLDLVAHQQLRAYLASWPLLDEQSLIARVGAVETVVVSVNRAEMLSNRHWTMVYLIQNPDWRGEGILVDRRGARGRVTIPALAQTTWMHLPGDFALNDPVPLAVRHVDLPGLEAFFTLDRG